MAKTIGIDLGTSNSVVAVMEGGSAKVIPSAEGNPTIPSIVAESKNGERLVGLLAKRQAVTNPENTINSVKRLIGRNFSDPEIGKAKTHLPYKIEAADDGSVRILMGDKKYSAQEISAMILQKIKTDAEAYLHEKVEQAVITVPAYFSDAQRQATKDAGKIAGLEVKRIINEPTASALSYGLEKEKEGRIAVYDLGGGTFDVTILEIGDGVFEVKSTSGNTFLGGDDFDLKVIEWLLEEFKKETGLDLKSDPMAMQRIKEAAEKAKVELSSTAETEINLPFITADPSGPKHLTKRLSRAKLDQLTADLIEKTKDSVLQALKDAKLETKAIDHIILVGGQTRMPAVQKFVKDLFGKEPERGVNPDEVVALGAAIQAGVLSGEVKDILLLDVTPLTLGIETLGGVMTPLIERNTTIPTQKTQIFSTAVDNQPSVEVHILQGERSMATDNRTLGRFALDGIPPAPRGIPQIEVSFDIDANGILNVKATDKATGKEQKITITASSGLSESEIKRMQEEAVKHAEEDKEQKDLVERKNQAEQAIYTAEKTLKEAGEKIEEPKKRQLEDEVIKVKDALATNKTEKIATAEASLMKLLTEIGTSLYQREQETASKTEPKEEEHKEPEQGPTEKAEEEGK